MLKVTNEMTVISGDNVGAMSIDIHDSKYGQLIELIETYETEYDMDVVIVDSAVYGSLGVVAAATMDVNSRPCLLVDGAVLTLAPCRFALMLAHEMVHAKDMFEGRLTITSDSMLHWEGETYDICNILTGIANKAQAEFKSGVDAYSMASVDGTMPWEVEAFYTTFILDADNHAYYSEETIDVALATFKANGLMA